MNHYDQPTRCRCMIAVGAMMVCILPSPRVSGAERSRDVKLGDSTKTLGQRPATGHYLSPDGKYEVQFVMIDASGQDRIRITAIHNGKRRTVTVASFRSLYKVQGFAWLPRHPHSLVLAVKQTDGPPYIGVWGGPSNHGLRIVFRGNLPPNTDPDAEFLTLWRVARDGRSIYYTYFDETSSTKEIAAAEEGKNLKRLAL